MELFALLVLAALLALLVIDRSPETPPVQIVYMRSPRSGGSAFGLVLFGAIAMLALLALLSR